MEFRQLNTFIAVANLRSFTQAADMLGYTQPSVTSQIQLLEGELGVRLFERIRKNISLTYEGEKFLVYAKQIIELGEEAKSEMKKSATPKGIITIGALESLCTTRVRDLLKCFHYKFPDIEIVLKTIKSGDYEQLLLENQIDIAFCLEPMITNSEFIVKIAIPEPLTLLSGPNHPLSKFTFSGPEEIAAFPLILAEEGCSYRRAILAMLNDYGLTPKSIMEIESIQAMKQLAIDGLGIILLPKIIVEEELSKGQLIELNWSGPSFNFLTQVIYHKDKWISPSLVALHNMVDEVFQMKNTLK